MHISWIALGAVFGGSAVAAGAFGAHGLKGSLEAGQLEIFETAVRYQMYHALALALVGVLAAQHSGAALRLSGVCFTAGIVIFCGLLYALALGGPKILGAIVPIGGVAFIVGWGALAWAGWKLLAR